ncbi:hypothetical protein ACFQH3_16295 [Haladaptatus sp. GCM10025707]|uniref:hypothetical protein n=1 Tax=unclassified Haladaptatus TaxID=2622732 RepID=UPI0023E8FC30|nr:hypothetical protein [Haladaptatus sp. QDMS2]
MNREESTFLTPRAYSRLKRATETYREELVVSLMGEAGLRPSEVARFTPATWSNKNATGRRTPSSGFRATSANGRRICSRTWPTTCASSLR